MKCKYCGGEGWYSDHSDRHYRTGESETCEQAGCPIQRECEYCNSLHNDTMQIGEKMKKLEDFNSDRLKSYSDFEKSMQPHPNGIECPSCGKELWDSDPMVTLTSNPPQKNIHCPNCGYCGYRFA